LEEQQIPIDYLAVNIDSWKEQHIPIDYLTVNIDSWEGQPIPIDYLTVNIDSWEEQQIPIDYLIVNIDSWKEHLTHWYETFSRLLLANLIVNLGKSDFCHVTVEFKGNTIGQWQLKHIIAQIGTIVRFPSPTYKKGHD
jgi:hypothetical protein